MRHRSLRVSVIADVWHRNGVEVVPFLLQSLNLVIRDEKRGFWCQRDVLGFHRPPVVVHALGVNSISDYATIVCFVFDAILFAGNDGKRKHGPRPFLRIVKKRPSGHRCPFHNDRLSVSLADYRQSRNNPIGDRAVIQQVNRFFGALLEPVFSNAYGITIQPSGHGA